jgi:capsular exopolysaccharide synthesis family protein
MNSPTMSAAGAPQITPLENPVQTHGFELGDILRILSEQRRIILGAGIIGLILGIVASLLMTPMYRSTALLEINNQASDMLANAGSKAPQTQQRLATQELVATQIGLLRSEKLARRVAEDLNLASLPDYGGDSGTREERTKRATEALMRDTTIEPVKNSLLIQVSQTAKDPAMAAKIAQGMADGFIASNLERRFDSSSYARKFLSDQLERTKASLEDSERKLNAYSMNSGVFRTQSVTVEGKTSEGATLAQSDLNLLNEALNVARVRRITAENAYKSASVDFSGDQVASVGPLVTQRAELQAQYDEKSKVFKADYPAMRELQARIARIDASITSERGRISGNRRSELQGEYQSAVRAEAQLAARVAAAKGEVQGERGRSIEYNILQREADTNRALYDALLQRYKEIGVAGGVGQSNVSVVDPADPPSYPYKPRLPVNAGIGLLLGLAVGMALAFAVHMLFDAIIDPADVRNKLHLPVLGVIPMDTEDRTLMEALADRKSDISEAYYSVRTALKFTSSKGAPRTLLVTSTRPGEGKSTSAYAVASSMARLGTKVLLIDADLRKPTFVSSRSDGYGLAHLLGTEEPLSAYVESTQSENLSLLPVGRFVGSAAELLSSNRLPAIIAEARDNYDMVVIDGPPVLGLTDAPLLGATAEATAIVIESRASRTGNVSEMVRRLAEAGARISGVILTKVTQGNAAYGYSYYSYSYGSDGVGGKVSSDPTRALDLNKVES